MSETTRFKINEAAMAMGCSNATVYNRIKRYGWQHETDSEGTAFVDIPKDYLNKSNTQFNKPETNDSEGSELHGQVLDKVVALLERSFEDRVKDKQELLQTKEQLLKSKDAQIEALNNQLSSVQNQLVSLRDKAKTEKTLPKRPWYQFWE